jgi:hypothetical protein
MKRTFTLITIITLLGFTHGLVSAAGPAAPAEQSVNGFELRVPAPGPDVIADDILQQAIDKIAAAMRMTRR